MDPAHKATDIQLSELEHRIREIYGKASEELQEKVDAYFAEFEKRDEEHKNLLDAGEITPEQYVQWRLAQIGRGRRFEALLNELTQRMTTANQVATSYMNDATPTIYSLNRNYAAYTIEQVGGDIGFTLYDEQTVARLIRDNPQLLPRPKVDIPKDLRWNRQKMVAEVTSGILQGESIEKIASRFQNVTDMNRTAALRNARTAVTGAQNAGRQDTYQAAANMGVGLQKEWVATLDGKTRHSHRQLDGEVVDYDAEFSNGCRYPGDSRGKAAEVYNCRCTMVAKVEGVDTSDAKRRARDPETGEWVLIQNMTYAEWEQWKNRAKASP